MDGPITVRYMWTLDELFRAYAAHNRRAVRHAYRVTITVIFIVAALMHFYIGYTERQWSYVGIGALLLIAFPLLGIMRRLIIRRQFAKRPDKDMAIAWRISSETLQNSCALAQATLQWDALVEVVEAPEGFLLYPIPQMFHWLPKDGFASDDDRAAFVAIAREKARKYMVVR